MDREISHGLLGIGIYVAALNAAILHGIELIVAFLLPLVPALLAHIAASKYTEMMSRRREHVHYINAAAVSTSLDEVRGFEVRLLAPAVYRIEPGFGLLEGGSLQQAVEGIRTAFHGSVSGGWFLEHDAQTKKLLGDFLSQATSLQKTYALRRDALSKRILSETNLKPGGILTRPQPGEINARGAAHALIWRTAVSSLPPEDRPLDELALEPPDGLSTDTATLLWKFSDHSQYMIASGTRARLEDASLILTRLLTDELRIGTADIERELAQLRERQAKLIRRLETVRSQGGPKGSCSDCQFRI